MRYFIPKAGCFALAFAMTWWGISLLAQKANLAKEGQRPDLKALLGGTYNLKPRYTPGTKKYYRLWITLENLDLWGKLVNRIQWRGDLERVVKSVDATGRAEEQITWKNIGKRNWSMEKARYEPHEAVPWAEGFTYPFSAEERYDEVRWDHRSTPRTPDGVTFVEVLQCTGHVEFDFLRSSHHADIEKLCRLGQVLTSVPQEGVPFHLNFPPLVTNSNLEKKHIQISFLGLTHINGEPCAIMDYRQGPQNFSWDTTSTEEVPHEIWSNGHTDLKSFHYGQFIVRLKDGSLVEGDFTERDILKISLQGSVAPISMSVRAVSQIREISRTDYGEGLAKWDTEQSPTPDLRGYDQAQADSALRPAGPLGEALRREYDLKPKYQAGAKRHYRLTVTRNFLDNWGNVAQRNQWRGNFERLVKSVDAQGKAYEQITWKNVGYREAGGLETKYAAPQTLPWAEGFRYRFSAEDGYVDYPWDRYAGIPKTLIGYLFKELTVDAHFEFDFLRSSSHGAIEKLRKVGDVVRVPDNEQPFALNHPPVFTESHLQREQVYTSFLGLTEANGQPCALVDFRQGPQKFRWLRQTEAGKEADEMTSWQYGVLQVRLEDGQLERGDFAERGMLKLVPPGSKEAQPAYVLDTFELERITAEEHAAGMKGWEQDQPVHPSGRVWDR